MDHYRAVVKREIFKAVNDKVARPFSKFYITGLQMRWPFGLVDMLSMKVQNPR